LTTRAERAEKFVVDVEELLEFRRLPDVLATVSRTWLEPSRAWYFTARDNRNKLLLEEHREERLLVVDLASAMNCESGRGRLRYQAPIEELLLRP